MSIDLDRDGAVAIITINRPERRNAMDAEHYAGLSRAWIELRDNPAIRAAIMATAKGAREIGDRAEAIRAGIAGLAPGDALVVAGKGHEVGQIVGGTTLPFSDHEAVAKALAEEGA